ncbi:MAG: ROK family protein [Clostridiaceae bacterium]|nr:ROK family protein [Clostridiaceae bacterium]
MDIAVLDIGGTAVKYGLYRHGRLCRRGQFYTLGEYGAQDLLRRAGDALATLAPFDAIGISTRGQITRDGKVYFDTEEIRGWSGTPVAELLQSRFSVPVTIENDVNCMALGEGARGAARGLQNFLCVAFGTGIGAGLVLNGRLYPGARGFAGEAGLMPFRDAVWEQYASVSALISLAHARDPEITDGHVLHARLDSNAAREALALWLPAAAHGLCGLIHTLDPEGVVLGGGLMTCPEITLPLAKAVRDILVPGFETTRIVPAALGQDAMLLGAAAAAKRRGFLR